MRGWSLKEKSDVVVLLEVLYDLGVVCSVSGFCILKNGVDVLEIDE